MLSLQFLPPGGYKGYGLAMMVETLCGLLSGSTYGPNVKPWKSLERIADLVIIIKSNDTYVMILMCTRVPEEVVPPH